jgi:hypothetical protein
MHKGIQVNINRVVGRTWLSIAALLLSVAFSSAAIADTGVLVVNVTDASGNPVSGASVSASTADSLTRKSGVTGADGAARLMGLDPSDNYVVTVTADGYQSARNENVLVVSERTFNIPFTLVGGAEQMEEIITYGRSDVGQLVDTTSALQSTDVTLDMMESLPTGRNYQSYLQMAPTTKPTNNEEGGNPSSKSGVNYSDIADSKGNTAGSSSDNVYYIDGINITDNYYGTFGANFNSEIIQEQQIITGGVPAEYEGGQGLISRVVTKSGGNEFHGSVNYYTQSDSLVADNENLDDAAFSTYDTAFTLGGPIIKDKLWFFTSYQKKERDEDVINPNTQTVQRTINRSVDYGFAKVTYQPTENDKIVAEWFNDPGTLSGGTNPATLNNRDRGLEYGGDNWNLEYSHSWENLIFTASYLSHEVEDTRVSADKSTRNDVAFRGVTVENTETDLGGYGNDLEWFKNKDSINLTLEYFADTNFGSHEIKAGYSNQTNEHFLNDVYTGDGAKYKSIASINSGVTLDEYGDGTWQGSTGIVSDDYLRIIAGMEASANYAAFLGALDTDASGDLSETEIGAMVMDSTAGNPNGQVNAYRIVQSVKGPQNLSTEGQTFFVQDSWNIDEHWTVGLGVRAEKWEHIASDEKTKVFTFDWEYAPRVSLVYDLKGDGSSKIWGFYGRYYDPIRTNMTDFAGSITGSVLDEQVYADNGGTGEWVTFRTRGGPGDPDGYFAPTIKTPYTDEVMLGWEQALTADQSISVTYTDRKTRDILEDYDLDLYTNCSDSGGDPWAGVGDYCLPLSYFGFDTAPAANYFIATLKGGERNYQGMEVTWRKRRSADSNWFGLASYSWNDAEGNTNSDSNADYQGDVVWLDPRSPNQYGKQPGNIEHLLKLSGSYSFDNGLEVGATYLWNSGTRYSRTFQAGSRHLPLRVSPADVPAADQVYDSDGNFRGYEYNGVVARWLTEDAVGGYENPSYGTLNARVKYVVDFGNDMSAEFFLDIFNVLDNQATNRQMDLSAGDGVYSFGEANQWVLPRRFYLGARMSF